MRKISIWLVVLAVASWVHTAQADQLVADFSEDWSNDIASKWNFHGSPNPFIDPADGLPAPALHGDADNNGSEGVYSKDFFDISNGFHVSVDMRDTAGYGETMSRTYLALTPENDFWDQIALVRVGAYTNLKNKYSTYGTSAGNEYYEEPQDKDNNWHRFTISVGTDLKVRFYRDDELMYESAGTIDPQTQNLVRIRLDTGDFSHFDNIEAHSYPYTPLVNVWNYTPPAGGSRGTALDALGNIYSAEEVNGTSYLYKLNPTGGLEWRVSLGSYNNAKGPSIDLDRGVVYTTVGNGFNNTGRLNAHDLDGNEVWPPYDVGGVAFNTPAIGPDGTVYVGDYSNNKVYAVNSDRSTKWSYSLPANVYMALVGVSISSNGKIALGTAGAAAEVRYLNTDGTEIWSYALGGSGVAGIALADNGDLIVCEQVSSGSAKLYRIDSNGNLVWSGINAGDDLYGPALAADGTIYTGSFDGKIYATNPNGSPKWEYNTGLLLGAPVAGIDGNVYVASRSGSGDQLYAFSAHGDLINQAALVGGYGGTWEVNSPTIGSDGRLYIGLRSNQLQAFEVSSRGLANSSWPKTNRDNQNTSLVPPVYISIADLTSFYAQPLSVPVEVAETDGEGIVSAEIFVVFDGDLLTPFSSPVSSTSMTSAWTIETNILEGNGTSIDTLKIAMADEVALTGAGNLLALHFDVADIRVPYTSPLALVHVLLNDGAPGAFATDGSVKLVGTTASTGVTPITGVIIPRETITINVNDADENTDPATGQQVSVLIVNGAQTETLTLDEQGIDTDLFSTTINTVFSLASTSAGTSGDGVVQAKSGDIITLFFNDQLTATGDGPVQIHGDIIVTGGSDGSLQTTVVAQPGDTVRVKVVDADMSGSVNVRVDNPRSGALEWLVLPEFSPGSSTFYGRFFTDEGAEVFGDSALSILDCDTLLISYYDDVTALGDSTTLLSQTNAVAPFGDADDNGSVQAFDAALALLHVLSPHLTLWDSLSVNVDSLAPFGPITPYDASLILQSRVGLISRFPVQTPIAVNQPQPETTQQPGPKLVPEARWLSLRAGADYLSVWAEDRSGILSGDLLIDGVKGQVQSGEELGGFLVKSLPADDGLRIVFAGAEAISGPGELLRLYGVGPEGAQLVRAAFNDGRITAQLENGPVQTVPKAYALHANAPNPFNPETVISFDLPRDSPVQLVVFDVLGQQVRSLVADRLPAGAHRAVWDGRNTRGAQVGSGVYFYHLQAGEFVQTRRMLLLK